MGFDIDIIASVIREIIYFPCYNNIPSKIKISDIQKIYSDNGFVDQKYSVIKFLVEIGIMKRNEGEKTYSVIDKNNELFICRDIADFYMKVEKENNKK